MAARERLTNNSDETDLAALFSGDSIFIIPYFQRSYKWKPARLQQLNADILRLVDEESDMHFLGAIIVHGRQSNPSDPDPYDVIDGQQRITTIYCYLCAVVRFLCSKEQYDDAAQLLLKYLVINRDTKGSNLKLHSGKEERAQINAVIDEILADGKLVAKLGGFKFKKLPVSASSKSTGVLVDNFRAALKFLEEEFVQGQLERVLEIYSCLLSKVSVVQIDVKDPASGPKIFDSLNSRQEPMTIGDLVRNEIFSKVAKDDLDAIEAVDQDHWGPFYARFSAGSKNLFEDYFFPFGLIANPNLSKSGVYRYLQKDWAKYNTATEIIDKLSGYQIYFLDLCNGTNDVNHQKEVAKAFKTLHRSGPPSSTFPFLMQLSKAVKDGVVAASTSIDILSVLESFLVRRAICGQEPTGLHAVFKRLWADMAGVISVECMIKEIRKHKTVVWPSAEDVEQAIKSRPLDKAGIVRFLLEEYDRSLGGDVPVDKPSIEHILPKKPDGGSHWRTIFKDAERGAMQGLLANLIPLSGAQNSSLQNSDFSDKRERYIQDAMYKTARQLGEGHEVWTPTTITERSEKMGVWAKERWSY